jgi:hypothetical protein
VVLENMAQAGLDIGLSDDGLYLARDFERASTTGV